MANLVESFCNLAGIKVPAESGHMLIFYGVSGDDRVEVELLPPSKKVRLHSFYDGTPNGMVDISEHDNALVASTGPDITVTVERPGWLKEVAELGRSPLIDIPAASMGLIRAADGDAEWQRIFRFARYA
jgi:hypothetical protein